MRRKEKEIRQPELIRRIMDEAQVCRLGLCKDNVPYIVPVSFGYDGTFIYFHTALEGRKNDFLTAGNRVCFELEHEVAIVPHADLGCGWTCSFYSIIGYGSVEELTGAAEREQGLQQIMLHYSGRAWQFQEQHLQHTRVWRLRVEQISGKQSRDKPGMQEMHTVST